MVKKKKNQPVANNPPKGQTKPHPGESLDNAKKTKAADKVPAKSSNDDQMKKILYLLGNIIEVVQYVEYNLSLALVYARTKKDLAVEKQRVGFISSPARNSISTRAKALQSAVSTMTLGALLATIAEADIMEKKELDELTDILQTRNLLVHQYFKKNDFENQQVNRDFLMGQANYLTRFLNRINNFNAFIYKRTAEMHNKLGNI